MKEAKNRWSFITEFSGLLCIMLVLFWSIVWILPNKWFGFDSVLDSRVIYYAVATGIILIALCVINRYSHHRALLLLSDEERESVLKRERQEKEKNRAREKLFWKHLVLPVIILLVMSAIALTLLRLLSFDADSAPHHLVTLTTSILLSFILIKAFLVLYLNEDLVAGENFLKKLFRRNK